MKRKYTKQLSAIIAGLTLFTFANGVLATTISGDSNIGSSSNESVQIGAKGNAMIRGTVASVGTNTLTLNSWGGIWIINTTTSTTGLPLSGITVGQIISIEGTASTTASWTIDAKMIGGEKVSDLRESPSKTSLGKSGKITGQESRKGELKKINEGTATNVTATSFTLTEKNNTVLTVNISPTTKLLDKQYKPITAIKSGDHVRIIGTLSGSTITATTVRDTTI